MNRRAFLVGAGTGAAVLGGYAIAGAFPGLLQPAGRRPRKHWAWLRGEVKVFDDWRRSLARMKAAGIDAVLIGGSPDFYRRAVPAAAAEGLELHAWIFTMMRGEHVAAHPDWYAVSRAGVSTAVKPPYVNYYRFMCPSREPVRQWLAGYVGELAAIDGLASVHLDYIRYPDVILPVALWPKYNLVQDKEYPEFDFCYCAECRDRFKRTSGIDPQQLADPPSHKAWVQYRCDTITEVVTLIVDQVHARKKLVTAAVFPTPAIARTLVRQEWTKWNVDAVLPMVYHGFYKEEVPWIERATREGVEALAGRVPLYSGLYVPDLPPTDLARAARFALAGGADGICLFQGNTLSPEHWQALTPVLAQKVGDVTLAQWMTGAVGVVILAQGGLQSQATVSPRGLDTLAFLPRHYVCYRTPADLTIDGRLSEPAWLAAAWTDAFVDIEGNFGPKPRFRTRAKMLWDAEAFYVAAELEEPDTWATLTQRDSVVFHDNDFEVFIDPDGDTHAYGEIEINALGTVWDLMLVRPYRDGGPAIAAWDIAGLQSAVDVSGTLNTPSDRDAGWTVEFAIPWRILAELASGKRPPKPGDQWRVNFSRVNWQVDSRDGRYTKRGDPGSGKPLAADNWVWSAQGAIDMHMPERWGYVQFSGANAGAAAEPFVEDPNERIKWSLRRLYYRQRQFRAANGRYAADLASLGPTDVRTDDPAFAPSMQATRDLYQISASGVGGVTLHIRQDGRAWTTR